VTDDLIANYELPDDIRRIAHDASNEAYKANGFGDIGAFQTSAALREMETIKFLGRTKRQMAYPEQHIAYEIGKVFPDLPVEEQRKLFEEWTSHGRLSDHPRAHYVAQLELNNSNYLSLEQFGFKSRADGRNVEIYHPKTGAVIRLRNPLVGGAFSFALTIRITGGLRNLQSRCGGKHSPAHRVLMALKSLNE